MQTLKHLKNILPLIFAMFSVSDSAYGTTDANHSMATFFQWRWLFCICFCCWCLLLSLLFFFFMNYLVYNSASFSFCLCFRFSISSSFISFSSGRAKLHKFSTLFVIESKNKNKITYRLCHFLVLVFLKSRWLSQSLSRASKNASFIYFLNFYPGYRCLYLMKLLSIMVPEELTGSGRTNRI